MALLDDVATNLARRAMEIMIRTGDESLEKRVADEIGASSPTVEEAYRTAMRMLKAERRAMLLLDKYEKGEAIPAAQISAQPQEDGGH